MKFYLAKFFNTVIPYNYYLDKGCNL